MGGCSASGCRNTTGSTGVRLFRFPRDKERRQIWYRNCREDNTWTLKENSRLCEAHFDDSQYEQKRQDKWRKLKPNAIPTIFNFKKSKSPELSAAENQIAAGNQNQNVQIQGNLLSNNFFYILRSGNQNQNNELQNKTIPESGSRLPKNPIYIFPPGKQIENIELQSENVSESSSRFPNEAKEAHQLVSCGNSTVGSNTKSVEDSKKYLEEIMKLQRQIVILNTSLNETEKELEKEFNDVKKRNREKEEELREFLNDDQYRSLSKSKVNEWNSDTVLKGLKFRYLLGVHGYKYLIESGYPLPSYSTLNRRLSIFNIDTGVLTDFLLPLKQKVSCMDVQDRVCSISVIEMPINAMEDFEQNNQKHVGYVTLGNTSELGTHLLLVVVRGVRANWKQIIACHITSSSTTKKDIARFIHKCIQNIEETGLSVLAFSSDLGDMNVGVCNELEIFAKKNGSVSNTFTSNGHRVYAIPDSRHLLKNLKKHFLSENIYLPTHFTESEGLPTNKISSTYVASLWRAELKVHKAIRTLHHLKSEDINPSNHEEKNVSSAARIFSDKTAAGIRLAVRYKILPGDAITTAWFLQLISDWFEIVSARRRQATITRRNKDEKLRFLIKFISIFKQLRIGESDHWKPLNYGMVLANTSIHDMSELLFTKKGFDFLLASRFNLDAIEKCFTQIREQAGPTLTAGQCLEAVKSTSLSQFVSDVRRSSYPTDSDLFLLDYYPNKKIIENQTSKKFVLHENDNPSPKFEDKFATIVLNSAEYILNNHESNLLIFVSKNTQNALFKTTICESCKFFCMNTGAVSNRNNKPNLYVNYLIEKGLKVTNMNIISLIINTEIIFKKYYRYILHSDPSELIQKIVNDIDINFPNCFCIDIKLFVVTYFFKIRYFSDVSLGIKRKRQRVIRDTSVKRRKTK